ncbi:hypothetical protein B0H66DRAFT_600004 [Apodospora peruviana]|uniref:Uncharacterized protein n=1 Tax=Apodospora peruviana TaxID=516989 RepID=A0AAE0IIS4_9PEZI|nr:hypothetical protein B0H66DRAFT_600004 [Apodospora peruviana]
MSSSANDKSAPQGEASEEVNKYKVMLDEAATKGRHPHGTYEENTENQSTGIVDKVAQYMPESISKKILGQHEKPGEDQASKAPTAVDESVPPKRPEHDEHIEEFVRDQHRSKELALEE